jgi:hypothetical protein
MTRGTRDAVSPESYPERERFLTCISFLFWSLPIFIVAALISSECLYSMEGGMKVLLLGKCQRWLCIFLLAVKAGLRWTFNQSNRSNGMRARLAIAFISFSPFPPFVLRTVGCKVPLKKNNPRTCPMDARNLPARKQDTEAKSESVGAKSERETK